MICADSRSSLEDPRGSSIGGRRPRESEAMPLLTDSVLPRMKEVLKDKDAEIERLRMQVYIVCYSVL